MEKKEFVEIFGILFETVGVPRVAGQIQGRLLVCNSPRQIAAELVNAAGAGRGLEMLRDERPGACRRLKECDDFSAFLDKAFPGPIKQWEDRRERAKS